VPARRRHRRVLQVPRPPRSFRGGSVSRWRSRPVTECRSCSTATGSN
jgi:hypothetical protein